MERELLSALELKRKTNPPPFPTSLQTPFKAGVGDGKAMIVGRGESREGL